MANRAATATAPTWATGNNPPMPQRGFTLLEMLAVILLISLAVGLLGLGARLAVQAPGRAPHAWPASLQVTLHSAEQVASAVEFYPDGSSTGGNLLLANGSRRWRIDIGWLTGSVQSKALP